jgi:hypothetical protein
VAWVSAQEPETVTLTADHFLLYLQVAMQQGMMDGTSIRCALTHFQLAGEAVDGMTLTDGVWSADEPVIRKAAEGVRYKGGRPDAPRPVPRGMIDTDMVIELLIWCGSRYPVLRTPLTILFFAALRLGELTRAHHGDYNSATRRLLVRGDKRYKASTCASREDFYEKPIVCDEAHNALVSAVLPVAPGATPELVWPRGHLPHGWSREDLSRVIQEARAALSWPPGLNYAPHSLRHGGVAEILSRVPSAAAADATQMTEGTRSRYAMPNAERKRLRDKQSE